MSAYAPGRHRLGTPGLRHCRDIPAVRARLEDRPPARHVMPRTSPSMRYLSPAMAAVLLAICVGALAVAGWLAGGTPAIADIVGR